MVKTIIMNRLLVPSETATSVILFQTFMLKLLKLPLWSTIQHQKLRYLKDHAALRVWPIMKNKMLFLQLLIKGHILMSP